MSIAPGSELLFADGFVRPVDAGAVCPCLSSGAARQHGPAHDEGVQSVSSFCTNCIASLQTLAGGVSAKDARALAPELRCTPEFILAQAKDGDGTAFAAFARNITPAAVSMRVPFFTMENMAAMSDAKLAELLARNRREVCG